MTQPGRVLTGDFTAHAATRDDYYNITSTGMVFKVEGAKYRLCFRRDKHMSIEVVTSTNIQLRNYPFGPTSSDIAMYYVDTSKPPILRVRIDQGSLNVTKTLSWDGATLPAEADFFVAGGASGFMIRLSSGKLQLKDVPIT
ncbi:hypothetical protein IMF22_01200 [Pseudomonas poae]|uniref:Uncharacterized protein n=1 Tax=Pseudomonas poae TaxID=200451 RepID=A0A7M1KHA4_9PSED|nr:hypothetical protein [Pseudomonas poae]QOQ75726.1 hypothetical protein IMF22_01200 [Pseudomonas poae]